MHDMATPWECHRRGSAWRRHHSDCDSAWRRRANSSWRDRTEDVWHQQSGGWTAANDRSCKRWSRNSEHAVSDVHSDVQGAKNWQDSPDLDSAHDCDRKSATVSWNQNLCQAKLHLAGLPSGAHVAILSFQGSFCPVTRGHVLCLVEAREMLLGLRHRGQSWVPRDLEKFSKVIGFMGCNSDRHVGKKLAPLSALPVADREHLIELATQDLDWLTVSRSAYEVVDELRQLFPELFIKHFVLDGEDAALWTKPWRRATDESRSIIIRRAADDEGKSGDSCGMRNAMAKDGLEFSSSRTCILWPELSAASSTAARAALASGDSAAQIDLLQPRVRDWLLRGRHYAAA